MANDTTDGPLRCLERMAKAVAVCAAGEKAMPTERDDGAGVVPKAKPQWASYDRLEYLMLEMRDHDEKLTTAEMWELCELVHKSLYKATASGSTVSLAAVQLTAEALKLVAAVAGRTPSKPGTPGGPKSRKRKPKSETPPKVKEKEKGKEREKGKGKQRRLEYPDEEGALGPNGLPRMRGGNPKGDKCGRLPTCPFTFCSFSHKD